MASRKRKNAAEQPQQLPQLEEPLQLDSYTIGQPDGALHGVSDLQPPTTGENKGSSSRKPKPSPVASVKKRKTSKQRIPAAYKSSGVQVQYNKLGFPKHKCRFCGATMWEEERYGPAKPETISFSSCCKEGKIKLAPLKEAPEPLRTLMTDHGTTGNKFRKKIRVYNSIFSYTSFGGHIDEKINETKGPYTFRMSGQNYHRIGSLLPQEGAQPRFAQLYFYDTDNEVKNRMSSLGLSKEDVDPVIIQQIIDMLNTNSAVAKSFRMTRDWSLANPGQEFSLKLIGDRSSTKKQYNTPTTSEIAGLIVGDFGEGNSQRDIVVSHKSGTLHRISELHPQYMALQYPLLFPYGEDGYHINIPYENNTGNKKTKRGMVTMKEYYSYRIQQRILESTNLLAAERLLHQYLVDAFSSIEEQRLTWIRYNQKELRADLYNNICDAVTRGDTDPQTIGQRIILPATFVGGPRYMMQNYQDAMAMCRAFGNPTLFITFTANPKWPEVAEMLAEMPGQTANDHPDIMSRIFKLKLGQLMKDLRRNEIFGPTKAAVYTIEFQKRGLPHAHILLWLDNKGETTTETEINEVISAEIPCEKKDPRLHKLVKEHMLHGPCGAETKHSPCMKDGKCTKHFPKQFYTSTTVDEEGYSVYRRRDDGKFVMKGKSKMDNRHVVPYNSYLLLKYQAHINVEWCNQSRAIKYLFKYISKGPDRATIMLLRTTVRCGEKIDEITEYLECRYISASEATWRILGFDIHQCNPSVIRLPIHLPNENQVTLNDTQSLETVMERDGIAKTMLTEWFTLNATDNRARNYTYAEIPQKYVWHEKDKEWKWRKQQTAIGRIVYCHPTAGERYYLRLLMNYVRGPTTFKEIRTFEGVVHDTFRKTCCARGMLTDDNEWGDALQEAKIWATGHQMRDLFVTMLMFCEVTSPGRLWEKNWEALTEDILYQKRKQFRFPTMELTENQIKNYALLHIEDILTANGKQLADYPDMPTPDKSLLSKIDNRLIQEEMNYNAKQLAQEHQEMHGKLNKEQLNIYNKVISSVEENIGEFFFVCGPGGTGKTFMYKTIMARLRSEGKIVLAVASSGIASLLLPGGRTAHSRFLIPLELHDHSTCGIKQNSNLAKLIHEVSLIIWDEAPMTQRAAFEALNRTLQDIQGIKSDHNRRRIFGGITMLMGGDFRQILPVITKGKRQEIVQATITNSDLWRQCEVLTLHQNMRVKETKEDGSIDREKQQFNEWILSVGDGTAPAISLQDDEEEVWIEIPQQFIEEPSIDGIKTAIDAVYSECKANKNNIPYLQERAILTPLNEDADKINTIMFNGMSGTERSYRSFDEVCLASTDTAEQYSMYPIEFLNGLDFPGMPPHNLNLKEGLPIMLLRNVNPTQGLCNGTRLLITQLGRRVVEAKIITGTHVGKKVVIPRIAMSTAPNKWPFVLKRRQFPVKPCFAMTINKSQGQSINHVALYLPKPVFCHGQLYVALSRVTDPKGLKIVMVNKDTQPRTRTKNIVFQEVFTALARQQ